MKPELELWVALGMTVMGIAMMGGVVGVLLLNIA